jgi:hypothetical protein
VRCGAAWPGDRLFCPFQCELFLLRNIQGRSLLLNDVVLLRSLQRANLNTFWSREPNTVAHSVSKVNHILQLGFEPGVETPPLSFAEPWPINDKINAAGVAVILHYSLDPGNTEDTVQFNIAREMKSDMVSMTCAVAGFDDNPIVGRSEGKKYTIARDCAFHDRCDHFMRGMHSMGYNMQHDLGLTADIMVKLMEWLELDWKYLEEGCHERAWIVHLGFFCLAGYAER